MRLLQFYLFAFSTTLAVLLSGCDDSENDRPLVQFSLHGVAQKGPFFPGTKITVLGLDDNMQPTGEQFDTETLDLRGSFEANFRIRAPYIELVAEGYFFREIPGIIHREPIRISSIVPASETSQEANINVLTWFRSERLRYLVQSDRLPFDQAKEKADVELFAALGFAGETFKPFETMDITGGDKGDALLFAASCWVTALDYTNSDSTRKSLAYMVEGLNHKMEQFRVGTLSSVSGTGRASELLKVREQLKNYLKEDLPVQPDFQRIALENHEFKVDNYQLKLRATYSQYVNIDPQDVQSVIVTFNLPVDTTTLREAFQLTDGTNPVDFRYRWLSETKIEFILKHYVKSNVTYTARFLPGVKNLFNSKALDQTLTLSFTTKCAKTIINNELKNFENQVVVGSLAGDKGNWTILRGVGGVLEDATKSNTIFRGQEDETYTLRWTLNNGCPNLSTDVVVSFTDPAVDYEGNVHGSVKIGNQVWMSENLRSLYDASGKPLSEVYLVSGGTNIAIAAKGERQYPWYIALNKQDSSSSNPSGVQGICPSGWHLPSVKEYNELTDFLATDGRAVHTLLKDDKSWNEVIAFGFPGGVNYYGFQAIQTGAVRGTNSGIQSNAFFWTSSRKPQSNDGYVFMVLNNNPQLYTNFQIWNYEMSWKFCVRCVRD